MKVNLYKNRLFKRNIILLWISFIIIFAFLLINNYNYNEGPVIFITYFRVYFLFLESHGFAEILFTFLTTISCILLLVNFVYLIWSSVLFFKKEKNISIKTLLFFENAFLIMMICFIIMHLLVIKIDVTLGYIMLCLMLIPVFGFAIYNLISTIIYYKNNKLQTKDN